MMKIKNNIKMSILLIFIIISEINSFKCDVKSLNITPGIIDTLPRKNKRRINDVNSGPPEGDKKEKMEEEEKYHNIIIGYDYTSFNNSKDVSNTTKNQLIKLLNEVKDMFKKSLSVGDKNKRIPISNDQLKDLIKVRCKRSENEIEEYVNKSVIIDNDVTIFPYFANFSSEESDDDIVWMRGRYCLITRDLFPIGGILEINKNISNINLTNENTYNYFKYILFHQMTHILVFDPNIMKGKNMIEDNQVITNGVKLAARTHFNCIKFIDDKDFGVPLDEDGYHWDSRYMLGDYMASFDYFDKTISDITFALFDDSGLYNVDYLYGKYFNFGKNKTCSFFEKKCIENGKPNFEEFCTTSNETKCSQSRISKGNCFINNYDYNISNGYQYFENKTLGGLEKTDYCPVSYAELDKNYYFSTSCKNQNNIPDKEFGETFGNDSFCFTITLNNTDKENKEKAICYEVDCDFKNKIIIVNINNSKFNCSTDGGIIFVEEFKGNLTCPPYNEICENNSSEICKDMFDCFDEKFRRDYVFDDEISGFIELNLIFFMTLFIFIIL